MEGSASAPALKVLADEDYRVPSDGIGMTGHPKRVTHGAMSKDKGTFSSRINQIIRQAEKVPGPGKYVAHEPWEEGKRAHVTHAGNKFPTCGLDYKQMNKVPSPDHYEHKEIGVSGKSNAGGDHLSNRKRIVLGKISKGKKRSFLDQIESRAKAYNTGPGSYEITKVKASNKLDTATSSSNIKVLQWSREMVNNSKGGHKDMDVGPNHYSINYKHSESAPSMITFPKAKAQNFLDKAVKEKWVDVKSKKECPGPGTYKHDYDESKISRGTRYLQLRGMSRSAASGYF
jgi:hypothetical protein|mmetsp:Transcript_18192/g.29585  ORF Transcript_18192/g.29585 Transcript_18192/m.29585 type:complete len:287 (-) Transcript_18192:68-928(-)